MIRIKHRGSFKNTEGFFKRALTMDQMKALKKYGEAGVQALASATPIDSGTTASSWGYEITQNRNGVGICFTNSNVNNGVNIALILQYGHGTGTGGYVRGRDYINPAIRPIFDGLANEVWREVVGR